MSVMVSQITSLTIVYSTVYSGSDQRKHQSSATLAYVRGNQRWPLNSLHIGPVTRKMFPFDDVIMVYHFQNSWYTMSWLYVHALHLDFCSICSVDRLVFTYPDSKVHGTNMGPTWGRQDPGGPHVGHMNLAIWVFYQHTYMISFTPLSMTSFLSNIPQHIECHWIQTCWYFVETHSWRNKTLCYIDPEWFFPAWSGILLQVIYSVVKNGCFSGKHGWCCGEWCQVFCWQGPRNSLTPPQQDCFTVSMVVHVQS